MYVRVDMPNIIEVNKVSISAGMGNLQSRTLRDLRFRVLDFEDGLGNYTLDCTCAIPDGARITTHLGLGSLTVVCS